MIARERMFEPLLDAEPGFRPHWDKSVREWQGEDLPHYLLLTDLAEYLIDLLARGETDRFDASFDVVERWQIEGDHYVSEAAVIGLLEDLQNEGLHTSTKPDDFIPWLRPLSASWWVRLDDFWAGNNNALRNSS